MSLVEYRLDGVYDKEQHAIETLQAFVPEEGYYVAFSGGKDSVCVKALCDLAGVKYDAHYRVTSVDPPELVQFIKRAYPEVEFDYPRYPDGSRINMWNLIAKKRMPPTRLARYCCQYLKEDGGYGRMTVTGVRWAESRNRKENQGLFTIYSMGGQLPQEMRDSPFTQETPRGGVILNSDNDETREFLESCYRLKKTVINPIIDWEDEDVWEFIHKHNIPYCELYDKGYTRLGCIGCPLGGHQHQKKEFEAYPKYKKAYTLAFQKMINKRLEDGIKTDEWRTGEEVMNWWLEEIDKSPKPLDGQIEIEL